MESSPRAPDRRVPEAQDASVQRLRRGRRGPLPRDGSAARLLVLAGGLAPAAWLLARAAAGDLGSEPIETLSQATGKWTLHLLLATLAVTPLARFLGWTRLLRHRRTLGLLAFAWASVHLLCFVALDQFFDWGAIGEEILERRWITIGIASFLCLVPLAVTSTNGWVRRLGARRWRRLHRLAYVAAAGGVTHFALAVKADRRAPIVYGVVLAVLLASRLVPRTRRAS